MRFGVFDHLDHSGAPLGAFYEDRLRFVEACDRAGFDSYHIAEHHTTPLGMAPSPSVYLSAVAQRTQRLRFGPLVYILPLYHPLRLYEEICMLDQMSGGRLELGFGRGVSPFEIENFGVDTQQTRAIYNEYMDVILRALRERAPAFEGAYYRAPALPLQMESVQKPHPPLWFGIGNLDNAVRAGKLGGHCVALQSSEAVKVFVDTWRAHLPATRPEAREPLFGQCLFMVLDDDAERAKDIARAGFARWRASFGFLHNHNGRAMNLGEQASDFDELMRGRRGFAGTPAQARDFLAAEIAISGVNYVVGQFYFGDVPREAAIRSVQLFASEVAPALREKAMA